MTMLPITHIDISKKLGREIGSPILIASLSSIDGIDKEEFLKFFSPLFAELSWDYYDVKRLQVEFLCNSFPDDKDKLNTLFKPYYTNQTSLDTYSPWLSRLSTEQKTEFEKIIPWRRRSVCQFVLIENDSGIEATRQAVPQFAQDTGEDDLRSWPRVFDESPVSHVGNELFLNLMKAVFKVVKKVSRSPISKLEITAHFMSVKARKNQPGNNSPEGAHEDGADFIISALVINRINLEGGESQVIELRESGKKEIIYRHILQPGEFIFQADSRDELIYGNDLWHHITPFHIADADGEESWRDIIGFDINVIS